MTVEGDPPPEGAVIPFMLMHDSPFWAADSFRSCTTWVLVLSTQASCRQLLPSKTSTGRVLWLVHWIAWFLLTGTSLSFGILYLHSFTIQSVDIRLLRFGFDERNYFCSRAWQINSWWHRSEVGTRSLDRYRDLISFFGVKHVCHGYSDPLLSSIFLVSVVLGILLMSIDGRLLLSPTTMIISIHQVSII